MEDRNLKGEVGTKIEKRRRRRVGEMREGERETRIGNSSGMENGGHVW